VHPTIAEEFAKAVQRDRLGSAARARLVREAGRGREDTFHRFRVRIGHTPGPAFYRLRRTIGALRLP
jgi:hypothetical protein